MELNFEEVITESNDDLNIWASITVGFDTFGNLVVKKEFIDYDEHDRDRESYAVVDKDDVETMSRHLKTDKKALPAILFKKFGDTSNTMVPSDVEKLFGDIVDFIFDCGAKCRLKD